MKKRMEKTVWQFGESQVPVTIHHEWRRSPRASLRKTGLIIRLPIIWNAGQKEIQISHFKKWAGQHIHKSEAFQKNFEEKTYQTGDLLHVGRHSYRLHLEYTDLSAHHARIDGKDIFLRLTRRDAVTNHPKATRQLLSRIVAGDLLPQVEARVHELNRKFIGKKVKNVSLKYNSSNWGSCSSKGNINLSTRLLFAPDDVIDYVILHELAHLVEQNHSSRFWSLVEQMMPDYKDKEKWLKKNWHQCDF